MRFNWDQAKAESNARKHGTSFFEATEVFSNSLSQTVHDIDHSEDEDRYITIGFTFQGRVLVFVHADHNDVVRIISARPASRREIKEYEDGTTSE